MIYAAAIPVQNKNQEGDLNKTNRLTITCLQNTLVKPFIAYLQQVGLFRGKSNYVLSSGNHKMMDDCEEQPLVSLSVTRDDK